jgi:hypothetical protein
MDNGKVIWWERHLDFHLFALVLNDDSIRDWKRLTAVCKFCEGEQFITERPEINEEMLRR